MNGILGGIGGAYLVLVQLGVFTENMISGRGYIALAAVILGRYTPVGTFGAALIFGGASPTDSTAGRRRAAAGPGAGNAALHYYIDRPARFHRAEQ